MSSEFCSICNVILSSIYSYELFIRRACPHPFADDDDPVKLNCSLTQWRSETRASGVLQANVSGLLAYSRYQIKLHVSNEHVMGQELEAVESPIATVITLPAGERERDEERRGRMRIA